MARTATHRRDLAEAFELGFVSRFVAPSSTVLDVGCGKDARLAFVLNEYPKRAPHAYLGLETTDLQGRIEDAPTWASFDGGKDLVACLSELRGTFSVIRWAGFGAATPKRATHEKTAAAIVDRLADGGVALLGFDTAGGVEVAAQVFERLGAEVTRVVGVRADDPARLKAELDAEGRRYLKTLAELFPSAVAGAFLAATEPDAATFRYAVVRKRDEAAPAEPKNTPHAKGERRERRAKLDGQTPEERAANVQKPRRATKAAPAAAEPAPAPFVKPRGAKAAQRAAAAPPVRGAAGTTFKVSKESFPAGTGFELTAAMLATGRFTREEILEARRSAFPNRRPQLSDVRFVERTLQKLGVAFPAPKAG